MTAMDQWHPAATRLSRRALLLALAGPSAALGASGGSVILPADWTVYPDPSTEFDVRRLTSPLYSSFLPAWPGRAVSRRSDFVVLASDRTATTALHRLDLKSGQSRVLYPLTDPRAFTLSSDDRTVCFRNRESVFAISSMGASHPVRLWQSARSEERAPLCLVEDAATLWFTTSTVDGVALMRIRLASRPEPILVLTHDAILEPLPNPRRALVLWRSTGDSLWLCEHDGANLRRLDTPSGRVLQALWSPDGQSVLYLHDPRPAPGSVAIREQDVDSRADRLVAATSQYACFARNANASVFLDASRGQAGPYVFLMLRITRRELPLCEHRSRDASASGLAVAPDSQRLLFQGDAEGRPVVYSMKLDKLVERTDF